MWSCSWIARQVYARAGRSAKWQLLWDIAKGIMSWSTYRRLHGKQGARGRNGSRARRKSFLERVVSRGCRNGCGGGALSPSWVGEIADGFAWGEPRGAGGIGHGVGILRCAREHTIESAGHNAAGAFGVVCDSADRKSTRLYSSHSSI